jgi:hypothetical protein
VYLVRSTKDIDMFKKSSKVTQLNVFSSPSSLLSGKALTEFEDKSKWFNQFYDVVTVNIDEEIFKDLYCQNNGKPNASIRVLVAMMILKEAAGLSDEQIFENCRYHLGYRNALGLFNINDQVPVESTYYKLRQKVVEYARVTGENLFDKAFKQLTKLQCQELKVSGQSIRMDSKLLGSNIAWLSRYEIVHETLRLFYAQVSKSDKIAQSIRARLDEMLQMEGNKIVYTCTSEEVKSRLQELGELIYKILPLFSGSALAHYETLQRVFDDHYEVDKNKLVVARDNKDISTKSVQSPHDPTVNFRNKDGNKVKGVVANIVESCHSENVVDLIGHTEVQPVNTPDVDLFQSGIKGSQDVFCDTVQAAHTDGAFHSPGNQDFCAENGIELYLTGIQGPKGQYAFTTDEQGEVLVIDTVTNKPVATTKKINKDQETQWSIKTENGYRYFTQKQIDTYNLRKKIEDTPIEILHKRNNVEATIFQLCYHYPNNKSRYRGLIQHQMWADIRCMWLNFARILKYITKAGLKKSIFGQMIEKTISNQIELIAKLILIAILPKYKFLYGNCRFSTS